MVVRWVAANLSSNGQPLPIAFNGSALGYVGWQVLLYVSFITIVGWAWVVTAWMRWVCRNIDGTQREVIFTATGLEVLWRTIVFVIACIFIIPFRGCCAGTRNGTRRNSHWPSAARGERLRRALV